MALSLTQRVEALEKRAEIVDGLQCAQARYEARLKTVEAAADADKMAAIVDRVDQLGQKLQIEITRHTVISEVYKLASSTMPPERAIQVMDEAMRFLDVDAKMVRALAAKTLGQIVNEIIERVARDEHN